MLRSCSKIVTTSVSSNGCCIVQQRCIQLSTTNFVVVKPPPVGGVKNLLKDASSSSFGSLKRQIDDAKQLDKEKQSNVDPRRGFRYPPKGERRQMASAYDGPLFDADLSTVLLFPGQGAQFVGMGKQLVDLPKVRDIYGAASEILGYNLLTLCLEGPSDKLDKTIHCQPAVFVTALAALERLKIMDPLAIEQCIATAGFSVGEYAALVFSGTLDFEDALRLLVIRAHAMQKCSEMLESGLLTVRLFASSRLGDAMEAAKQHVWNEIAGASADDDTVDVLGEDGSIFVAQDSRSPPPRAMPICQTAIDLFTQCKVIGGDERCLRWLEANGGAYDVRPLKRVRVSGAFHTPLMARAASKLWHSTRNIPLKPPKLPVIANFNGDAYPTDIANKQEFRRRLANQVQRRVKWEQTLHSLFNASRDYFKDRKTPKIYELGPGRQLLTIMRRYNRNVAARMTAVPV